ncbi:MAG: hypothetical protein AAFP82_06215, partial [Bacteroidota bacterium]
MDEKIEKKRPIGKYALITLGVLLMGFLLTSIYKDAGTSRLNVEQERLLTDTIHSGVFKEFFTIVPSSTKISSIFPLSM